MIIRDEVIPPSIIPFIKNQFPAIYQAEDANFIEFMKTYYLWLEQNGKPLYYARNFLKLMDVDATTEDVLVFIKEKYLKNIQFDTEANIRSIIKHCLDIYRSKGSQRCIDLLFRLVFNEVIEIYYPKDDLFKLSDGTWRIPRYLEISLSPYNALMRHKVIRGERSGSIAFVDDVVRRSIKERFIDLAYISAISGAFQTGEIVRPVDESLEVEKCPVIIGSLNKIKIATTGTGQGYVNGDIVNIFSNFGEQAEALVINATDLPSPIAAIVDDGGYGYNSSSDVIVSDKIISLENVVVTNTYAMYYLRPFETITQGSNSATVVGIQDLVLNLNNVTGSFIVGEKIVQHNKLYTYDTSEQGAGTIDEKPLPNVLWIAKGFKGVFRNNSPIVGVTSKATANVLSVAFDVGINNIVVGFSNTSITAAGITADLPYIGFDCKPSYTIAENFLYTETVSVNTDRLDDWTEALNAAQYNYGTDLTANSGDGFNTFLTMVDIDVGKLTDLIPQSTTFLTDFLPIILISNKYIKDMNIRDKRLFYTAASSNFRVGEVVAQTATAARGIVQSIDDVNHSLYVQELRFYTDNTFVPTVGTSTKLIGDKSGAIADIVVVSEQAVTPTGLNAQITPVAPVANGNIVELKVIELGFGYTNDEFVWFNKGTVHDANTGYGVSSLITNGIGEGFYEQKGGFLSDQKKLFDGYYWQNWSYEIASSKTVDKYQDMMRKIGHPAGTKMFGKYVYKRELDCSTHRTQIEITEDQNV